MDVQTLIILLTTSIFGFCVFFAIHQTLTVPERFDKSVFSKMPPDSFWGREQWRRKYHWFTISLFFGDLSEITWERKPRIVRWYYRFFNVPYLEAFPFSATMLVFLTDAMHFSQWMMFNFFSLAIATAIGCSTGNVFIPFITTRILIAVAFSLLFDVILIRKK